MTDQPLRAFAPPANLGQFGIFVSAPLVVEILLAIVFGLWLIFTLTAIYHWLKFSHSSIAAIPAIILHLLVSLALMSYGLTGIIFPAP